MSFSALHAVALVVFLGAVAGATYGVQTILGDPAGGPLVGVEPAYGSLNATSGHVVTYPVTLRNRGEADADARLVVATAGFAGQTGLERVPGGERVTVFLPVEVAAGTPPGEHALALRIVDARGETLRELPGALKARILAEGPSFQQGDSATVVYTARFQETGGAFFSNDPALDDKSPHARFAKAADYRSSATPIRITTVPEPSVIEGLHEGMLGMQEGESRTLVVPPEKGFGPATLTEERDRVERIPRERELPVSERTAPRAGFDGHIAQTGQGDPATFEAGDRFYDVEAGTRVPYVVVAIDADQVRFRFSPEVGERFTLHDAWPNASEVVEVANDSVRFRTTPTTGVGERATYYSYWPNASEVAELTDEEIVVRHSPAVGTAHDETNPALRQPRRYTVAELTEDKIVLTYAASSPFAGRTLVFDVRMVSLTKG